MKRKKIIIFIVTSVLLVLLCGTYFIYDNYRFGLDLYSAAGDLSVQCQNLADSMDDLENQFENPNNDHDNVNRQSFDFAIASVRSSFGEENMPLLEDVRSDLVDRFEELYHETVSDENLAVLFTDKEKLKEIAVLQDRLNILADSLVDFRNRYNQMAFWERCFVSWRNEQRILSDKAIIS